MYTFTTDYYFSKVDFQIIVVFYLSPNWQRLAKFLFAQIKSKSKVTLRKYLNTEYIKIHIDFKLRSKQIHPICHEL